MKGWFCVGERVVLCGGKGGSVWRKGWFCVEERVVLCEW